MYRMFLLLWAVLLVGGVIGSGYCYNHLQVSPREPQFPFVYELTYRFQARYVDYFHYQMCPVAEVTFAISFIGPLLIMGISAILSPEPFRAFTRAHDVRVLPFDRMKSIDIRGYGVVMVVIAGLATTIFVLARSSN